MKPIEAVVLVLVVGACHQNPPAEGPFERAGKHVDHAAQKTGHALQGAAKKTGEGAEKAARATGRALGKVGAKLEGKPDPASEKPTSEKKSD